MSQGSVSLSLSLRGWQVCLSVASSSYTTIGAGAWNVVLALLGYFIGKTVPPELFAETIQRYSSIIGLIILGVLVVGGVGYYLYKRRQKAA